MPSALKRIRDETSNAALNKNFNRSNAEKICHVFFSPCFVYIWYRWFVWNFSRSYFSHWEFAPGFLELSSQITKKISKDSFRKLIFILEEHHEPLEAIIVQELYNICSVSGYHKILAIILTHVFAGNFRNTSRIFGLIHLWSFPENPIGIYSVDEF